MKSSKISKNRKLRAIDYLIVLIFSGFLTAALGVLISAGDSLPFANKINAYFPICEAVFRWFVCFYIFYLFFGIILFLCSSISASVKQVKRFIELKNEYAEIVPSEQQANA